MQYIIVRDGNVYEVPLGKTPREDLEIAIELYGNHKAISTNTQMYKVTDVTHIAENILNPKS